MAWRIKEAKKVKNGADKLIGARVVFDNGESETIQGAPIPDTDPVEYQVVANPAYQAEEKSWGKGDMGPAEFRTMLLGDGGTIQEPGGECLAWINHFDLQERTEEDL